MPFGVRKPKEIRHVASVKAQSGLSHRVGKPEACARLLHRLGGPSPSLRQLSGPLGLEKMAREKSRERPPRLFDRSAPEQECIWTSCALIVWRQEVMLTPDLV